MPARGRAVPSPVHAAAFVLLLRCDRCRKTGYSGRLGIYEMLVMDDSLRDLVTRNPDVTQLRKLCRERGLVSLREDGFLKVMKGLTTVDEILSGLPRGAKPCARRATRATRRRRRREPLRP